MLKRKKQLTLGNFFKKTAKQPDQEDQPNVAGGSTSYVVTAATTEPREEGANVSASANLTANVNLGAEETQEDEP